MWGLARASVQVAFAGMTLFCLVSCLVPELQRFVCVRRDLTGSARAHARLLTHRAGRYGKLRRQGRSGRKNDEKGVFPAWAQALVERNVFYVPSRVAFRLFYSTLFALCAAALGGLVAEIGLPSCPGGGVAHYGGEQILTWLLLLLHASRRIGECWLVHRFSAHSRQHLLVTAGGLAFYVLVAVTPAVDPGPSCFRRALEGRDVLRLACGVLLFFGASLQQHRCHCILADIRVLGTKASCYAIPRGGWFECVSSPHYLAEILIYLAFGIVSPSPTQWLCFGWVTTNLGVTAIRTHCWYSQTFEVYDKLNRRAIIPFLL